MNADEIVKALRDDFAPQVREMCANDDFSCDELCAGNIMTSQCIIFQAADLITSQRAEIDRLKCELNSVNAIFSGANKTLEEYAQSARVVALYLEKFCDRSLPYDEMIADAARKVNAEFERYYEGTVKND